MLAGPGGRARHTILESKHNMNHGHHWAAIYNDDERTMHAIQWLLKNGELSHLQPEGEGWEDAYIYLQGPDFPLSALGIIHKGETSNEFINGYPLMLEGSDNELEILTIEELPDSDVQTEAIVTCITKDGSEISFHCPYWLSNRLDLNQSGRFMFAATGLAYTLEKAVTEIVISEGSLFEMEKRKRMDEDPDFDPEEFKSITVSVANLKTYYTKGEGDVEFQSVIEKVTPFSSIGATGFILLLNLTPDDREPIYVNIYATSQVLKGYEPVVGHSVIGVAWLQANPYEKVERESAWLESEEAAHGSRDRGMMEMISYVFDNTHLPIAVRVIGGALVRSGWNIVMTGDRFFVDGVPSIVAENKDKRHCFFIRTQLDGVFEAEPFDALQDIVSRRLAEHQMTGHFVVVTLTSRGRNYAISADGLGDLADELTIIREVRKPEEDQPLVIDGPQPPVPVLSEMEANESFIQAMRELTLFDFSRMLVEDIKYVSTVAKVAIVGKQKFLDYFGSKLSAWHNSTPQFKFLPAFIKVDNVERPCVVGINQDNQPISYTVFNGRKGLVASIRTETFDSSLVQFADSK